ncbi:glycosyltransferase family 2 protein [Allochromatium tepidum]|uniref:Glycosyl transferase n=1 Tax=Allochromatium tepidum TaxID=553982 RepID=A0ABM7QID9_9GAMM|nr:glycosyltransferase family 2 protein [Allochromatium tepidum]BCU05537.1 glycosyl transferase [Allochromatium tepidum]
MTDPDQPSIPAVSLILVNYNAGPLLTEAVGAALASSVPVEVIVSDNGSRDDSLDRLAQAHGRDARLRILENGANLGFAAANNRALPLARAERLLFLNPDCLVAPDTLERLIAILDARPEVGMIGCLVLDPDGTEQVACRRAIPDPRIALRRILRLDRLNRSGAGRRLDQRHQPLPTEPIEVEAISGSFMLTTRRALERVGPLDEGYFLHCEDLDWFVRFHEAGLKILFVPDVSVIHHKGACSTGDPLAVERHKHRGMERFFRKHQMQRHSRLFGALVIFGIRVHFGLKAIAIRLRSGSRR